MKTIIPMSIGQQGLWYLARSSDKACASYNVVLAFRSSGPIDLARLEHAFGIVAERHPIITARVTVVDYVPQLDCTECLRAPIRRIKGRLQDCAQSEASTPIDLESGPLYRVAIVECADESEGLLITIHHIVFDGASACVLLDELANAFQLERHTEISGCAYVAGGSYAQKEEAFLNSERGRALLQKTAAGLLDLSFPFSLPVAGTRTGLAGPAGSTGLDIAPELSQRIRAVAAKAGTTMAPIYLSAFFLLIWQYTHLEDLAVVVPVDAREPDDRSTIGYMVNTAVLRMSLNPNDTLAATVERVTDRQFEALEARNVPFPMLVRTIKGLGGMANETWLNLMFSYISAGKRAWKLGSTELVPVPVVPAYAKSLLKLEIEELENGARCVFDYDASAIEEHTIQRMLEHYLFLVERIIDDPSQFLSDVPTLLPHEWQRIVMDWNKTASKYPKDLCIHQVFEEQVAQTPDAVAVIFENQRLTYRELNNRSNQLAHYLKEIGVGRETPVAICVERSLDIIVGLLGVLKAGGAYLPLDPSYPIARLTYMLQDSGVDLILTQKQLQDRLPPTRARILSLDADWGDIDWPTSDPPNINYPDSLAYVMYTSGSTGMPKSVGIPHRGVIRLVSDPNYIHLGPDETLLLAAPIAFDTSTLEIWGALLNGGRLVIMPSGHHNLVDLARIIQQHGVSSFVLTPALFNFFTLEHVAALANVRQMLVGGDVVSCEAVRRAMVAMPKGRLINGYGPTETTTLATCFEFPERFAAAVAPIGRPISDTQTYVLNEWLQIMPVGVPGELFIAGDGLARGYLNRPDLTAERFIPNPFDKRGNRMYRTGDLARYRPDGNIEFLGRLDHQVKIRGFRVELGEIEAALHRCECVREAVVLAREDEPGEKRLTAYVVGTARAQLTVTDLRTWLLRILPEYMVPPFWVFLDALPLNANGKVDRNALLKMKINHADGLSTSPALSTETERWVAETWIHVLKVEQVGRNDNFFALGGHSLLATQIVARAGKRLGRVVPLRLLLDFPTLSAFAEQLDRLPASREATHTIPAVTRRARIPSSMHKR